MTRPVPGTRPAGLTLDEVAVFTPQRVASVEQVALDLGLSRAQARLLRRVHGFERVRLDPELGLFELLVTAARAVLPAGPDRAAIRYLICAHTVLNLTPPLVYAADVLRARLGLVRAEAFALTHQHCAGGLSALDVAGQLLRADPDPTARALVVVGEKPFPALAQVIAHTTATGEGAAACLVSLGGGRDRVLSYADRTVRLLSAGAGRWLTVEAEREFGAGYPRHLAQVAQEAVRQAGLRLSDITLVLPHNVSQLLWRQVGGILGIGSDRIYLDTLAEYGHCHGADPLLNLVALRTADQLVAGGRYLLTSVGLGTTYAAMVVEHGPEVEAQWMV